MTRSRCGWLTALAQFGDPTATTGYVLCVYDDGAFKLEVDVEASATLWSNSGTGFLYKNPAGNADSVVSVKAKDGSSIKLKAKGPNLPEPSPPLAFTDLVNVIAQYSRTDGTECWEATYPTAAIKNDATQFKDKMP